MLLRVLILALLLFQSASIGVSFDPMPGCFPCSGD